MLRRFMPYIFAGLTGVVSGVYIFKPLFEEAAANRKSSSATDASPEVPGKPPGPSPWPHSSAK